VILMKSKKKKQWRVISIHKSDDGTQTAREDARNQKTGAGGGAGGYQEEQNGYKVHDGC